MRMSCNGCRVLRKGCSENCTIRPCLHWLQTPTSQGNATLFLAKFYGRAGLLNLINSGPEHLRPAIFRSLLYEACGRILNPIYGSVGLLSSGSWHLCQAAVEAVLKGSPITPISSDVAAPRLKGYDVRHVSKDVNSAASNGRNRVKIRSRVRRSKPKGKDINRANGSKANDEFTLSPSHESSLSHQSELVTVDRECKDTESMVSSVLVGGEPVKGNEGISHQEIGLDLTLGLETIARAKRVVSVKKRKVEADDSCGDDTCKIELGL